MAKTTVRQYPRLRPDSKGRITLGKLAEGVSSYQLKPLPDGKLLLEPFTEIPARERWLWKNPEALRGVMKGLAESAAGKVSYAGSFAKYAGKDKN